MGAACVGRNVPADLGLLGGSGIGREEEAVLAGEPSHGGRPHPGLDAHAPEKRLEGSDPVEAFERENDATVQRNGAGREARSPTTGHDGKVVCVAPAQDGRDLLGRLGQRNGVRAPAEPAPLGLVAQVRRRVAWEDAVRAEQALELSVKRARRHLRDRTSRRSGGRSLAALTSRLGSGIRPVETVS